MSIPDYGPIRRVYGECDCVVGKMGGTGNLCIPPCASRTVIAYERDRLVDCPEERCTKGVTDIAGGRSGGGRMESYRVTKCPTCPDEHPGKVVKPCGTCSDLDTYDPVSMDLHGNLEYEPPCPDCNGTGVETQRITRDYLLGMIGWALSNASDYYTKYDDDERDFALSVLEAGLL